MNSTTEIDDYFIDVNASLWCFEGHFEGHPILPGVFQIRDLVLYRARETWPFLKKLVRVSRLKFKKPIRPGERLHIHLERNGLRVAFQIHSEEAICGSGFLWFE
jgi:3-hydroxymyristoyl/3-hydroxydecanoyl-(acyl carrier protein) dehydratase